MVWKKSSEGTQKICYDTSQTPASTLDIWWASTLPIELEHWTINDKEDDTNFLSTKEPFQREQEIFEVVELYVIYHVL